MWRDKLSGTLRERLDGRRFVLVDTMGPRAARWRDALEPVGAELVAAVSAEGPPSVQPHLIAPPPSPERGPTALATAFLGSMQDPPATVQRLLDRCDPERTAEVISGPLADPFGRMLAQRARFGPREPAWIALEDKTTIDPVFDALGVPHPESVTCAAGDAATQAAALDRGAGTIWATSGIHGGATGLHWVRRGDPHPEVRGRVRIATFVPGLPCSVHGLVLADEVVVTGPMRILCYARQTPTGQRIHFGGVSSLLDADPAPLRALARQTGIGLRRRFGYRGMFGLDGVLGAEGFVATELNARISLGSGTATAGLEGLHLMLLAMVACSDPTLARVPGLQEAVDAHLAAEPRQSVLSMAVTDGPCGALDIRGAAVRVRSMGADRLLTATLTADHTPADVSAILMEADETFGMGLGPLVPLT